VTPTVGAEEEPMFADDFLPVFDVSDTVATVLVGEP
jgi:hypothetical protein